VKENYNLVVFACLKWGYSAADLAGVSRLKYTPSVKIIKVRCTGRIDLKHILFSIISGADGVILVGWRPNECQFKNGNFTAQKHVDLANRILKNRGFGDRRVNMYWLSGAESEKFVRSVEDAYKKVKESGPNPLKTMDIKIPKEKIAITPVEWVL
jgi:coenzyme F420-reducing hydrogenase delta subunit